MSCCTFLSKPCRQNVVNRHSSGFNPHPSQTFFQFLDLFEARFFVLWWHMFWAFALTLRPLFSTTGIVCITSVLACEVGLAVCYSSSLKGQGSLMMASFISTQKQSHGRFISTQKQSHSRLIRWTCSYRHWLCVQYHLNLARIISRVTSRLAWCSRRSLPTSTRDSKFASDFLSRAQILM